MKGEKTEQTEATKLTERRFSFASFALLVCFVWMRRLNIPCPGRRETERNSVSARGAENARLRPGEHNWRRASNETLTNWERFVAKPGQVLFYKSKLQPGDCYGHVKKTLIAGTDLRQCLHGRRRAGGQGLAARHDHRFKWGGGGGRDRHYHGDAY